MICIGRMGRVGCPWYVVMVHRQPKVSGIPVGRHQSDKTN